MGGGLPRREHSVQHFLVSKFLQFLYTLSSEEVREPDLGESGTHAHVQNEREGEHN